MLLILGVYHIRYRKSKIKGYNNLKRLYGQITASYKDLQLSKYKKTSLVNFYLTDHYASKFNGIRLVLDKEEIEKIKEKLTLLLSDNYFERNKIQEVLNANNEDFACKLRSFINTREKVTNQPPIVSGRRKIQEIKSYNQPSIWMQGSDYDEMIKKGYHIEFMKTEDK